MYQRKNGYSKNLKLKYNTNEKITKKKTKAIKYLNVKERWKFKLILSEEKEN